MSQPTPPNSDRSKTSKPQHPVKNDPENLSRDLEYQAMLEHYQQAEFSSCAVLLIYLERRYSGHPDLQKFKDALHMKESLKLMKDTYQHEEEHQKKKATLKLTGFGILSVIIILIAFFVSYYFLFNAAVDARSAAQMAQLTTLYQQADLLLLTGQPAPAADIIARIRSVNPDFENLSELTARTEELTELEAKYRAAIDLADENKNDQALALLIEIEMERPGLWDVSQQINNSETAVQIGNFLEDGNEAFQRGNWSQVINAYESALTMDPGLNNPLFKEQLLKAYLNEIINLLQDESAPIEDIERAGQYYRKAIIMIPQSREFTSERLNLQEVSSNLLEAKFTQLARAGLADRNQTRWSIINAVGYMRKAANVKPRNAALQLDLINAEQYHIGFQNFIDMNWAQAITNFNQIIASDLNFAGGNARVLLYEAYIANGRQYFSAGFYLDALNHFEQAEFLAWDDQDNLTRLFQVQILIGDTLGTLGDFENAVSYYLFAMEAIQVLPRLSDHPDLASIIQEANALAASERFEDAYKAYKEFLLSVDVVYTITEGEISDGASVALFASENYSTMQAVLDANDLPRNMVIAIGRSLKVPIIGQ